MAEAFDNPGVRIPALHESLAEVSAGLEQFETWVLRRDGRLIGSVRGARDGSDWEIGRLMVAPDLSGQGLGRMLLTHIERQAPVGVRRHWLLTGENSLRNHRLYRAAGYEALPAEDESLARVPGTLRFVKPAN
ncbi:GNAT family N-acetyltransferase [Micropruina sp. KQZ13P-5]|nr:GNAT family N-acetyltransferase [Micropruina sp. KQZ13P-5]MCW3159600.1 GNAT family N-acetyltransferase [Micropruina sp. KQZ13P-5]